MVGEVQPVPWLDGPVGQAWLVRARGHDHTLAAVEIGLHLAPTVSQHTRHTPMHPHVDPGPGGPCKGGHGVSCAHAGREGGAAGWERGCGESDPGAGRGMRHVTRVGDSGELGSVVEIEVVVRRGIWVPGQVGGGVAHTECEW